MYHYLISHKWEIFIGKYSFFEKYEELIICNFFLGKMNVLQAEYTQLFMLITCQ